MRTSSSGVAYLLLALALIAAVSHSASASDCGGAYARLVKQPGVNPLLGIQDEEARRTFLRDTFHDGDQNFLSAEVFARFVQELPPEEQVHWRSSIGAIYREMPKEASGDSSAQAFARRLMDRAYHLIARPDLSFAERVKAGSTATQAFRDELNAQAAVFGGNYGGDEVLGIAKLVQNFLRDFKRDPMHDAYDPGLTLGGSFLNGKARLGVSDIDISDKSNPTPHMLNAMQDELQKSVDAFLAARGKNKMSIETDGNPDEFFGQLNTFAIKVTKDGAELLVYPPNPTSSMNPLHFQVLPVKPIPLDLN